MTAPSYKGFTLIETAIVIGIMVMTLIALVNLQRTFYSLFGYEQVYVSAAGSASAMMRAFEDAILPADQVLASHDFGTATYMSATTTLVLELPSVDSTGTIVSGAKDYVAFYASSTSLYRSTATDARSSRIPGTVRLSSSLLSVSFVYDNADFTKVTNVSATVRTQGQYKTQVASSTESETLYLRNL